jgi:hypothetical protein
MRPSRSDGIAAMFESPPWRQMLIGPQHLHEYADATQPRSLDLVSPCMLHPRGE